MSIEDEDLAWARIDTEPSNEYIRFDEYFDVVSSLRALSDVLFRALNHGDQWKWVILSATAPFKGRSAAQFAKAIRQAVYPTGLFRKCMNGWRCKQGVEPPSQ